MKAYICDQCHTQAPIDATSSFDILPSGWYSMYRSGNSLTRHTCCVACLVRLVAAEDDKDVTKREATHG